MGTVELDHPPADPADSPSSIRCTACDAALRSPGRDTVSFLLVDQLTIPLVGCPDHLTQFSTVCGLTNYYSMSASRVPYFRQKKSVVSQSLLEFSSNWLP